MLRGEGNAVIDFGDSLSNPDDDYPDFVLPLARAVACGDIRDILHTDYKSTGSKLASFGLQT
jgi:hypothetical protein